MLHRQLFLAHHAAGDPRLSPLKDRHINFMGRYPFNIKASRPARACALSGTRTPPKTTWATTERACYVQWRRGGTYHSELSERWFGEVVAVPGGCGRFAHRLLEDSYSVFDAAEVDETLGTERAADCRVPFEDCGGFLSAASFSKHVGQDPGRVPGVALGVRPRVLDRFIEQPQSERDGLDPGVRRFSSRKPSIPSTSPFSTFLPK
ncbi:hypothetical protein ABZ371_05185 [Streptomyces sp. NPDC005899]|uniref:hypothetical protein n=1 Tax=Streptomyces sp. NPDC005899 TaxID=3155716 RepID=UPI0033DB44C9